MKFTVLLLTVVWFVPLANAKPRIHEKMQERQEARHRFGKADDLLNYDGIIKISGCSASLVRFDASTADQKAIMMTNGHCVDTDDGEFIPPNQYLENRPDHAKATFLFPDGKTNPSAVTNATRVLYATLTKNDVAFYELKDTYQELADQFHVHPITIARNHPKVSDSIAILSGYWNESYECVIDRFIYHLLEGDFVSEDSIRYSPECKTKHGSSGSPIISKTSGKIIGINSTSNDNGELCTMDNPCEKSEDGSIYAEKGRHYGEQVTHVYTCLNAKNEIDLSVPGCALFH